MFPPRELDVSSQLCLSPCAEAIDPFPDFSASPGIGKIEDYFLPQKQLNCHPSALSNQQDFGGFYQDHQMQPQAFLNSGFQSWNQQPQNFLWNQPQQFPPNFNQFHLNYQPALLNPAMPPTHQAPAEQKENSDKPLIHFNIICGLAVLNAGQAVDTQDVYSFAMHHWPQLLSSERCNAWKSNIRHQLAVREHFTKVDGDSLLKSKYELNKKNPDWLKEKVTRLENWRIDNGLPLERYELKDSSVWQSMVEGSLGLPPRVSTDGRTNGTRKKPKTRRAAAASSSMHASPSADIAAHQLLPLYTQNHGQMEMQQQQFNYNEPPQNLLFQQEIAYPQQYVHNPVV